MVKSFATKQVKKVSGKYFDYYSYLLQREILGECETVLDVGCGSSSPIQQFSEQLEYSVGVDIFGPAVEESRQAGIHNEYSAIDALEAGERFKEKSFDCVLALNLIEHLSKEDGLRLITMMEKIAKKKVIIFTPNGFLPQGANENMFQEHLSGWTSKEMTDLGYRVIGAGGWKGLRRGGEIVWRPKPFWKGVSLLTQVLTRNYPEHTFYLFCVKEIE
ncbi:class I SAM-dependent methyltransferase [Patescibacteria group bacterium]|nr:class I SAM-dependent methyltransferase [Patescibacteria group bacterium]